MLVPLLDMDLKNLLLWQQALQSRPNCGEGRADKSSVKVWSEVESGLVSTFLTVMGFSAPES